MFIANQQWADRVVGDNIAQSDQNRRITFEKCEVNLGEADETRIERLERHNRHAQDLVEVYRQNELEETLFGVAPDLLPWTFTKVRCAYDVGENEWSAEISQLTTFEVSNRTLTGADARKIAQATGDEQALASYLNTHHDPAYAKVYDTYFDMCFDAAVMEGDLKACEPYSEMLDIAFDTYATRDFAPVRDVCPQWDEMGAEDQGAWLAEHVGSVVGASFAQMEENLRQPYGIEGLDHDFGLSGTYDVDDYYDHVSFTSTTSATR